ncbi:unnamed protein product, partial [Symbiodinium microadriaticum]
MLVLVVNIINKISIVCDPHRVGITEEGVMEAVEKICLRRREHIERYRSLAVQLSVFATGVSRAAGSVPSTHTDDQSAKMPSMSAEPEFFFPLLISALSEKFMEKTKILRQHFLDMLHSSTNDAPVPHRMATLKRVALVIAGHEAVYVRVDNEHQSERFRRFESGGWHRKNNSLYNHYQDGRFVRNLIGDLMGSPEEKW